MRSVALEQECIEGVCRSRSLVFFLSALVFVARGRRPCVAFHARGRCSAVAVAVARLCRGAPLARRGERVRDARLRHCAMEELVPSLARAVHPSLARETAHARVLRAERQRRPWKARSARRKSACFEREECLSCEGILGCIVGEVEEVGVDGCRGRELERACERFGRLPRACAARDALVARERLPEPPHGREGLAHARERHNAANHLRFRDDVQAREHETRAVAEAGTLVEDERLQRFCVTWGGFDGDGFAADEGVDERALADVGLADNPNHGSRGARRLRLLERPSDAVAALIVDAKAAVLYDDTATHGPHAIDASKLRSIELGVVFHVRLARLGRHSRGLALRHERALRGASRRGGSCCAAALLARTRVSTILVVLAFQPLHRCGNLAVNRT
mmetsp:Transcript_11132/g.36634  ORF Transcript_11132/g.36634 Transcript_11132/m.36634 type:complete len:394 (-) Transcript_11132:890-2071(-)